MTTDSSPVSDKGPLMFQEAESGMESSLRKLRIQIEGLDRRIERLWALGHEQPGTCHRSLDGEEVPLDVSFHRIYRLKADI